MTGQHKLSTSSGLAYCSCCAHWTGIHAQVMGEAHVAASESV